jgi:hypothetical protein
VSVFYNERCTRDATRARLGSIATVTHLTEKIASIF